MPCQLKILILIAIGILPDTNSLTFFSRASQLRKDLLTNYDKHVVPITGLHDMVSVKIGLTLVNIKELNTKSNTFDGKFYLSLSWKDSRLAWDATKYKNITHVNSFLPSEIWTPDIFLYSGEVTTRHLVIGKISAAIDNDGSVQWVSPIFVENPCTDSLEFEPHSFNRMMAAKVLKNVTTKVHDKGHHKKLVPAHNKSVTHEEVGNHSNSSAPKSVPVHVHHKIKHHKVHHSLNDSELEKEFLPDKYKLSRWCSFRFGSWAIPATHIDLHYCPHDGNKVDLHMYNQELGTNDGWEIVANFAETVKHTCGEEAHHPSVIYHVKFVQKF